MEPRHEVVTVEKGRQVDLRMAPSPVREIVPIKVYVKEDGAFDVKKRDRPSICWTFTGAVLVRDPSHRATTVLTEKGTFYAELSAETLLPVIEAIRKFWPEYAR